MKKLFAVPAAVLLLAACSESTAPTSDLNASPRYAKPTPPPAAYACTGTCNVDNTFTFDTDISATGTGGATVGTEIQAGASGTADAAAVVTAPSGQNFIGRFNQVQTNVVIHVPSGNSSYDLAFDFYTIGSWDGRGKQAQNGVFQANVFDISYRCVSAPATITSIYKTSFSNQLTVQQDYPLAYLSGGNKAATGSFATDALNYKSRPDLSNTPQFRSFGDVSYHMDFTGANPCGAGAVDFLISTSAPLQQSNYDESWGVDNIHVRADS